MREFIVTERGYFTEDGEVAVGERLKFDELPATLVGKVEEVVAERYLEVSTPKRKAKE